MRERFRMLRMFAVVVVLAVAALAGCEGCSSTAIAPHHEALAKGQVPRTEEAIAAQNRCKVGSASPEDCDAVSDSLKKDVVIFRELAGQPPTQ